MLSYIRNWNFIRLLRLGLGIIILIQGIQSKEWILAGLGVVFSILALLNIGCCGTNSCAVPPKGKY